MRKNKIKVKFEFEVDKNEIAVEAFRRIVEDKLASDSIKKPTAPLFPKIPYDKDKHEEDWKDYEKELDKYRNRLHQAFKNVKILK